MRVLGPPCASESGHHVCLTHDLHFRNNLEAGFHEKDGCVFAWYCNDHGLESA